MMDEPKYVTTDGRYIVKATDLMARTITLAGPDGRKAVIDFGGPRVTYSGDLPVASSARVFFEAVGELLKGPKSE
jgi:hypothetical protein